MKESQFQITRIGYREKQGRNKGKQNWDWIVKSGYRKN
jgi:hypothetical protein